uniref:Uncharacterized protein n=1 Tax=Rhizophora mucronata TaxID=61149 RepID=A0A2P2PYI4_RHIMU
MFEQEEYYLSDVSRKVSNFKQA